MPECQTILDQIEASLAGGNVRHRLKLLQHVTDLFVAGSRSFSGAEIALFDDVLIQLAIEIEIEARKRLAQRLAALPDSPPKLMRQLSFDDAIVVAGPVLVASLQLSDADLVENAATKSQDHLYAIAQRLKLSESVTDILVGRGNRRVVRRTARNGGARFSLAGYQRVVELARRDRRLALTVAERSDIPHQCYLKLLETASAEVRRKLEAINPNAAGAIRDAVGAVASTKQCEARESSPGYLNAARDLRHIFRGHGFSETNVHGPARSQQFEKTAVALSMLGLLPIEIVERALLDKGTDMILILAKAAGCSWITTKAMLTMHAADRGLSNHEIKVALKSYERLSYETARRVVNFYERRSKATENSGSRSKPSVTLTQAKPQSPVHQAPVGSRRDASPPGTPGPRHRVGRHDAPLADLGAGREQLIEAASPASRVAARDAGVDHQEAIAAS
jgi:uncharacterized protein (DUF2336 family)